MRILLRSVERDEMQLWQICDKKNKKQSFEYGRERANEEADTVRTSIDLLINTFLPNWNEPTHLRKDRKIVRKIEYRRRAWTRRKEFMNSGDK